MEVYLIKSGISLAVLYLAYRFLLRQPLSHQANRLLGLFCIVFSVVLPFVGFESIPVVQETLEGSLVETISLSLSVIPEQSESQSNINIWLWLYLAGAGVFSARFLNSMIHLARLYAGATKNHERGFLVARVDKPLSPFTFFNILFIGNDQLDKEQLEAVMVHEKYHRDQWHSADSLLLEFATILFWFHPAIWLFQKAIRSEHEFMADKQVLNLGFDLTDYQQLLFQSTTGVAVSLGNNLINKVSLIKRFEMMTQVERKSKRVYYRIGWHACIMAVLVLSTAFTNPGELLTSVDSQAVYKEGQAEMYRLIRSQVKYPATARQQGNTGSVVVSFRVNTDGSVDQVKAKQRRGERLQKVVVVGYADQSTDADTSGVSKELKAEVIRVVNKLGEFTPAQKDGKSVSTVLNIPFEFKLK